MSLLLGWAHISNGDRKMGLVGLSSADIVYNFFAPIESNKVYLILEVSASLGWAHTSSDGRKTGSI